MDFNFYEQYQQLKNTELLLMIERQEQFQDAAIAAARKVLGEREITDEDRSAVQAVLDAEAYAAEQKKQKRQKRAAVAVEVAEHIVPLHHNPAAFDPQKTVNVLLVTVAIYFLMRAYSIVRMIHFLYNCEYCEVDSLAILTISEIVFIPIVLYLFWKRKRWGWILLLGTSIFILSDRLIQLYFVSTNPSSSGNDYGVLLISIFIRSAFIYALWQRTVADIFLITRKERESTLIVVSVLVALYLSCLVIMANGISF